MYKRAQRYTINVPDDIAKNTRDHITYLERMITALEGRLGAEGIETIGVHHPSMYDWSPQEVSMYEILLAAYPKAVNKYVIEENLPKHDHALERNIKIIDVVIYKLRKRIGFDAIDVQWGIGYRLTKPVDFEKVVDQTPP